MLSSGRVGLEEDVIVNNKKTSPPESKFTEVQSFGNSPSTVDEEQLYDVRTISQKRNLYRANYLPDRNSENKVKLKDQIDILILPDNYFDSTSKKEYPLHVLALTNTITNADDYALLYSQDYITLLVQCTSVFPYLQDKGEEASYLIAPIPDFAELHFTNLISEVPSAMLHTRALIQDVIKRWRVDPGRVYVSSFFRSSVMVSTMYRYLSDIISGFILNAYTSYKYSTLLNNDIKAQNMNVLYIYNKGEYNTMNESVEYSSLSELCTMLTAPVIDEYFNMEKITEEVTGASGEELFGPQGGASQRTYNASSGSKFRVLLTNKTTGYLEETYYAYFYGIVKDFILNNKKIPNYKSIPQLLRPISKSIEIRNYFHEKVFPLNNRIYDMGEGFSLKNKEYLCFSTYNIGPTQVTTDYLEHPKKYKNFNGVCKLRFVSSSLLYIDFFILKFKNTSINDNLLYLSDELKEERFINKKLYFKYTRDGNQIIMDTTNFEGQGLGFGNELTLTRDNSYQRSRVVYGLAGILFLSEDATSIVYPSQLNTLTNTKVFTQTFRTIDQDIIFQDYI